MELKPQPGNFPIKNHFIFWMIFIAYEIIISRSYSGTFSSVLDYITYYTLNITLFYIHAQCLISFSFSGRLKYILWLLVFAAELLSYLFIKYIISICYYKIGLYQSAPSKVGVFFREGVWRGFYFMGLGSAYGFFVSSIRYKNRVTELEIGKLQNQIALKELENEKLFSDIAFLKVQINPHFIFNTLSLIHNDVARLSEEAGERLLMLSDVMRFAIEEPGPDGKIDLEIELTYIENYVFLNQERFNKELNIHLSVTGEVSEARIIPLIIITLIENVFKYGELRRKEYPAKIDIGVENGQLQLLITNRKRSGNYLKGFGIGMKNIRRRLDLHYMNNYTLEIEQALEDYSLRLYINLL
ncbi:histidine kinase [Mucilaginibacter sp. KACC 22773]|uniref:sensor histidine kinase n=1 Tax=Mucilaginibacter sp. KACC 22773 TaxID=3025671 RepID=UPI00236591BA|nr:histidine kinase [Mucilaginibacter sp. KACC 22773]WDF77693.1 histidine kinase [Mucilaginibacter sp. KACC 22773]